MPSLASRGLIALALPAALAALAGSAQAKPIRGTVVHRNAHAHAFVVADSRGRLRSIHARRSPRPGRTVSVSARRLRNGTYRARHVRVTGRRRRARLRGTVSYVDRRRGVFTVSTRGASILVHRGRSHRARTADALPGVGDHVTVTADVQDESVDADSIHGDGQNHDAFDLEGIVLGVDPVARTVKVSADDDDESGAAITVTVPASFDMSQFTVGQEVELRVLRQADGTFVLQGFASDENVSEADDPGEQHGEHPGKQHGEQHGEHPGEQGGEQGAADTGEHAGASGDSSPTSSGGEEHGDG
jgi:hypothetical protein